MAKEINKKENKKEDEKLNESDVNVTNNNEDVTSNEEKTDENKENVQVEKVPTVKEIFRDKYDGKIIYNIGDIFILDEGLKDNKPVKVKDKEYKVSKGRYEELKRSLYVD